MNPTIILWAYTITMFISATLLFLVQPIIGKILIPFLGGAPSVWNTCMVFFQAVLLLGYLYAHGMSKLHPKRQLQIHLVILIVTGLTLPITSPSGVPPQDAPLGWLLLALVGLIGAPFFAVSTTAPLLQSWFSHSTHPTAKDPYHLYAASNLGSMTSLLGYPFLIEPFAKLQTQTLGWSVGFGVFAISVVLCGVLLTKSMAQPAQDEQEAQPEEVPPLTFKQVGTWILLAFVPSSLVLGTTTYVTMDVASIPLLWLVPLALYLLTFILVFSNRITLNTKRLIQLSLLIAPLAAMIEWAGSTGFHVGIVVGVHMALLFIFALTSHALLAERRPHVKHLTAFFLWMSFGGVLGGAFNGLFAPFFFRSLVEYWLILALAVVVFIYPWHKTEEGEAPEKPAKKAIFHHVLVVAIAAGFAALTYYFFNDNKMSFDFKPLAITLLIAGVYLLSSYRFKAILCAFIACGVLVLHYQKFYQDLGITDLHLERSFFGVHRVYRQGSTIRLGHGTTFHGSQHAEFPHLPTTYYSIPGPLGQLMKLLEDVNRSPKHVAAIGLGAGTVATYATPTRKIDFYEIDPVVGKIAANPAFFTYLQQCGKQCTVHIGDGRLKLKHTAKENSLDMLILDAYSSDAIPVHLSTKQALEIYWGKLKPDGLIAFHISNRHFNLKPVLARLAQEFDATAYVQHNFYLSKNDKLSTASSWVVMGRKEANMEGLFGKKAKWKKLKVKPGDLLWTDSYSNLLRVLK